MATLVVDISWVHRYWDRTLPKMNQAGMRYRKGGLVYTRHSSLNTWL